jgi:hypothetical protein
MSLLFRIANRNRSKDEASYQRVRSALIVQKIRRVYDANEENAILRKKLNGNDNGEFEKFNAYVEACIVEADKELNDAGT